MQKNIGVFDSGYGGISVLIALKKVLPNENYVYYADNSNAPYGSKSNRNIIKLSVDICNFLLERGAKAIIVACNTATSAAIETLRIKYTIPIIGMEPALKPALSLGGKTIILGTKATLKNKKLESLVKRLNPSEEIVLIDGSKLVSYVEDFHTETDEFQKLLKELLDDQLDAKNIVLGCTHFLFFKKQISELLPEATIIDGHLGTANRLKQVLDDNNLLENLEGTIDFYSSNGINSATKAKRLYHTNQNLDIFLL